MAGVNGDRAYKSYREAEFAKAIGRTVPVFSEREIVVVREPRREYLRQGEWREIARVCG
jgi:hypothetical protein